MGHYWYKTCSRPCLQDANNSTHNPVVVIDDMENAHFGGMNC